MRCGQAARDPQRRVARWRGIQCCLPLLPRRTVLRSQSTSPSSIRRIHECGTRAYALRLYFSFFFIDIFITSFLFVCASAPVTLFFAMVFVASRVCSPQGTQSPWGPSRSTARDPASSPAAGTGAPRRAGCVGARARMGRNGGSQ